LQGISNYATKFGMPPAQSCTILLRALTLADPEFIRFLKIARRSASEVQSELYLALDRKYITNDELGTAYDIATEAKRLINGMIGYLRQSKK